MGRTLMRRKEYIIFRSSSGYIVHNTNKPFSRGHTHLRTLKEAKFILFHAYNKKVPRKASLPRYYIRSLIRVTNDTTYVNRLLNFERGLSENVRKERI